MKRQRKKFLIYFLVLLMMCSAFAFEPIPAKAATTYTVTTETELRDALSNVSDGDTIIVKNENVYNLYVTEYVTINKSITLDLQSPISFQQTFDEYGNATNNLPEAVVIVDGCDVTIKGTNHTIPGADGVYAYKVIDNNGDATLTLESTGTLTNGVYIVDDSSNSFTASLIINKGYYDIPTGRTSAFTFSDGTNIVNSGNLVTNSGTFSENVEAYLGENTVMYNDYENSYEVRSTVMSEEFASMLTDGKLVVSSVVPEDEEEDGYAYVMGELCLYETSEVFYMPQYISDGVWDIGAWDNETGDLLENHRVEVVFEAEVDNAALAVTEDIVDNLPYVEETEEWDDGTGNIQTSTWRYSPFKITDMEVVNMWASGYDVNDAVCHRHTVNYSGELKEYLGNANVDFRVTMIGAGIDTDLYLEAAGEAVVFVNGVMYAAAPYSVHGVVEHIIYVPDGTATDKDALMTAAQKRINEYLGSDSKVVVSYGGTYNTLSNTWWEQDDAAYQAEMLDYLGLTSAPQHYFIATSGDMQYKFIIIPDSSKMITPTYKTVDATSNVTITSNASEIPLDTSMRANQLTSGDTYDEIISTLGVEENVTFDLKLYSQSTSEYISSLEDDVFEVSIPIPSTLKEKSLVAYYVGDNGEITKYAVEIVDDYAVFETNHFSIYTIAEGVADVCAVNGAAHKLTAVAAKEATTTSEGNKAYWTCDCGKWFADADGKTEITDKASVIIPKLSAGESAGEPEKAPDASPATGDTTSLALLFICLIICGGLIVKLGYNRKTI